MSKHTESNLFIFPSLSRAAQYYQHLLRGITTYEELGSRVLHRIKDAYAFRQVERVVELSKLLTRIPIKEYQLIGRYYLVWCQFRGAECNDKILESIIGQTQTYKSKALTSRAGFEVYKDKPETALYFYAEAMRANPTVSEYIVASRGLATTKSMEGFHAAALKDLERLIPLLKHAEPITYYDVLNSYAVELVEHNRLSEAQNVSMIAVSSPFGSFYPEWKETLSDITSKRRHRSTVIISGSPIQESKSRPQVPAHVIRKAKVRAVMDFMQGNLQRTLSSTELAKVVNLSPTYFAYLFKLETGVAPGEYLIRLKMEKAGQLLTTTFLSVKEIMSEVGYNNKSNFGRYFKQHFHVTPSEYRHRALAGQSIKNE